MQLNSATSQSEIDQMLDEEKYLGVVNASGWPCTYKNAHTCK